MADISVKMVLGMLFLTFSNLNIKFSKKKLTWRFYTAAKALPITKPIEFIDKKKFAKATLNENIEAFVMHVIFLNLSSMFIHLARKA